jgi:hypothetical protein
MGTTALLAIVLIVIAAAIAVGVFVWVSRRPAPPPAPAPPAPAPKEKPLVDVWRRVAATLPERARDGPVVVLLGERLSGKSTLARAALASDPLAGLAPSGDADPRLTVYSGRGLVVLEVAADILTDPTEETESGLSALWEELAPRGLSALLVLSASSRTWVDAGLRDIARVVRRKLDALSKVTGASVSAGVCVTHVDEAAPGFLALADAAAERGGLQALDLSPWDGEALRKGMSPWHEHTRAGLRRTDLPALVTFLASEGPRLVGALSPFFDVLRASGAAVPAVHGLFLCASPPGGPAPIGGDPLRAAASADVQRGRIFLLRWARIAAPAAALLAALGIAVALDYGLRVEPAERAIADLERVYQQGAGDPERARAEHAAAASVEQIAPPHLFAFAGTKEGLVARYTSLVRERALLPLVRSADRATRVRASAVLCAPEHETLANLVRSGPEWASALGLSGETLSTYSNLGPPCASRDFEGLSPPDSARPGMSLADWRRFLGDLQRASAREVLFSCKPLDAAASDGCEPESVKELQRAGEDLGRALASARAESELSRAVGLLAEQGLDPDRLFGPQTSGDAATWMLQNVAEIQAILALVRGTSIAPPSAAGKSLRDAVVDLQSIAAQSPVYERPAEVAAAPRPSATATGAGGLLGSLFASASAAPGVLPGVVPTAAAAPLVSAAPGASAASAAPSGATSGAPAASASAAAGAASAPAPPVYTVLLDAQRFSLDTAVWSKLLTASRAALYVDELLRDAAAARRSLLFRPNAYFPAVGTARSPGRGPTRTIDGLYSRKAYDEEIAPGLAGIGPATKSAGLPAFDRGRLSGAVLRAAEEHGKARRAAILDYYKSYRLSPGSTSALQVDVIDIVSPGSFFADFLAQAADSANVGPAPDPPDPAWRVIADSLSDLSPIVRLMAKDNGEYKELKKYNAILLPLVPSIDSTAPPAPPKGSPLDARLSPIGKLGMRVLKDPAAAPHTTMDSFLNEMAIPRDLRAPFTAPLALAYRLARLDVDRHVEEAYRQEVVPVVSPLLSLFPFNQRADVDAKAAEVEATFGPKGTLFAAFDAQIGPVCKEVGTGKYQGLEWPLGAGAVAIPAGALRLVSWAVHVRAVLFGADGKPRLIPYRAKPLPLPLVEPDRTVTLSYLRSGATSLHGFNQTPAWQAFPVSWFGGDTAAVGLQTRPTGGGDPRDQSFGAPASDFAFYHLLMRGKVEDKVVTWTFPPETPGGPQRAISFAFDVSPWIPFAPAVQP